MAIPLCFYGKARVGDACVALARSLGIEIDQKDDGDSNFNAASYAAVIPTPGVPPKNRAYSGRNLLSELDFAHRYLPEGFKIVTVTGTDGKSTTAWMLFEIFRQEYGDGNVFLSGNFEVPFSETVRTIRERGLKRGIVVIEASSFMLHNVGTPSSLAALASLPGGERRWGFSTDYSIFTNFESDHLNWHADLAEYFEDKMRMVRLTGNLAAINEQVRERSRACGLNFAMPSQVVPFGSDSSLPNRTDGEEIVVSGQPETLLLSETRFSGLHNALNVLSCAVVACAMGIPLERIRQHLKNVSTLPHRLEFVTEKNGVRFVDDSKSTSCQSLKAALSAYGPKSVRLIAGGSDKGDPFEGLAEPLGEKVAFAALIGATATILAKICERAWVPFRICESMDEAVSAAADGATPWQTVLLSPGCASFGMFRDYLDRAEKFREAVGK